MYQRLEQCPWIRGMLIDPWQSSSLPYQFWTLWCTVVNSLDFPVCLIHVQSLSISLASRHELHTLSTWVFTIPLCYVSSDIHGKPDYYLAAITHTHFPVAAREIHLPYRAASVFPTKAHALWYYVTCPTTRQAPIRYRQQAETIERAVLVWRMHSGTGCRNRTALPGSRQVGGYVLNNLRK